jgi:chemotaxis signal transduction protein
MLEPYILFEVAGSAYAVPSDQVLQVEMIENITRVPNTPGFIEGVAHVRGQVIPVINLRLRFGMERIPYDLRSRLVVISLGARTIGLAVDTAREFMRLSPEQILPPPESLAGPGIEYLEGVVSLKERLILVVNLHALISSQEKVQLSETIQPDAPAGHTMEGASHV